MFQERENTVPYGSGDHLVSWYVFRQFSEFCKNMIRPDDILQPTAVIIKIIIDDRRIWSLSYRDMGEQPGATKQIHKNGSILYRLQNIPVLIRKHSFLPHKRQGC